MKAHNFLVRNAVQLDVGGRCVDLRESYLFEGFTYDVTKTSVLLHWREKDPVVPSRNALFLIFEGVRCVQVERGVPRTDAKPIEVADSRDAKTLNCIGYLRQDVASHWPIIMDEPAPDEWVWTFEFDSGCTFSIDAEIVTAEVAERSALQN